MSPSRATASCASTTRASFKAELGARSLAVFVGEHQDGQRNGQGTYTSASGAGFVGEYQKDRKHGKGMYTYENGDVEVGVYDQGEDKGRAVKLSADRTKAWPCMDGRKVAQECGLPPLP